MPVFSYEAMDSRGRAVRGEVEAASPDDAGAKLRQQGLFPTNVKLKSAGPATAAAVKTDVESRSSFFLGRVSHKDLTVFTRQLATLLDAGLPIVRSLEILEGQMRRPLRLKYALRDIVDDVKAGATLSEAMSKFPRIFDTLYTNMIRAGEAGGVLVPILERLATFMEKSLRLRKRVKSALIYPIFVILFAGGVMFAIMKYVIPNFEKVFKDMGQGNMPQLTVMVLGVARFVQHHWYLIILAPVAVFAILKLIRLSEAGALALDRLKLSIPILGRIVAKSQTARFTRTLGTLVASGVPILDALDIIRDTTGNLVFSNVVAQVHENIRQGGTIAEQLGNSGVFDDIVVNMVQVGEETGELDKMLLRVADSYDEEVDNLVQGLVSLLEPAIIILMGVGVGFIVIALFLPLITLMTSLSKGGGAK